MANKLAIYAKVSFSESNEQHTSRQQANNKQTDTNHKQMEQTTNKQELTVNKPDKQKTETKN